MNIGKAISILAVGLSFSPAALAAEHAHLAPCDDLVVSRSALVETLNRRAMPGALNFSASVLENGAGWTIGVSTKGSDHFATLSYFVDDYDRRTRRNVSKTVPIDAALFTRLEKVWADALMTVGTPVSFGVDGIDYKFNMSGKSACTWSPSLDTPNAFRVELLQELRKFINGWRDSSPVPEAPVLVALEKLSTQ